ncbi:sugar ABC transporter permease [Asticcacaulis sp. AC460]|uniref:carbohydrate ABC transporter permease n=1 Tax=Asticcacaulis sp. AC460 TaxID=1282360 RepID=UPI0003C3ADF3|nr:carbohydrate ABC transporter permease [Asticcacaulis sp. AC460]ESQ91073.1 sugar ABC transporter permease [Asticcacaulis sp. AC460]
MIKRVPTLIAGTVLVFATIWAAFPLFWMTSMSFMPEAEANAFPARLLPVDPTLDNYAELFAYQHMGRYVLNSLFVACLATALSLAFNVTAGYAFAKLRFKGREKLFQALLAALVIPGQLTMLPLFFLLKNLHLLNTYVGVVVPFMSSLFGIFLVRQYALSLPDEMLQAARVDGASEWQVFRRIVLPNLRPIMVTLGVFTFLAAWNDFLWPLIVLSDDAYYTLPLAIAALSQEHLQDQGLMMAGATVTIAPVLILFILLQRHYVRGLLSGSVKG